MNTQMSVTELLLVLVHVIGMLFCNLSLIPLPFLFPQSHEDLSAHALLYPAFSIHVVPMQRHCHFGHLSLIFTCLFQQPNFQLYLGLASDP